MSNPHDSFWEELYLALTPRLTGYALHLTNGRKHDAEDLVQTAFTRAINYVKNPQDLKNPDAYLSRTIKHAWIEKWKKERPEDMQSVHELCEGSQEKQHRSVEPAVEPDAPRLMELAEYRAQMRKHQGSLTPREDLLLRLYCLDYKCDEIAQMLDEDVKTVSHDLNAMRTKVIARIRSKAVDAVKSKKSSAIAVPGSVKKR